MPLQRRPQTAGLVVQAHAGVPDGTDGLLPAGRLDPDLRVDPEPGRTREHLVAAAPDLGRDRLFCREYRARPGC